jgi:hypothetical protein
VRLEERPHVLLLVRAQLARREVLSLKGVRLSLVHPLFHTKLG